MPTVEQIFVEMKGFLDFGEDDVVRLKTLHPIFEKRGGGITDTFYEVLGRFPTTAAMVDGRVDALKKTHKMWMMDLFAGNYGVEYMQKHLVIGQRHVQVGLPAYYVEFVMSIIRMGGLEAITAEMKDPAQVTAHYSSLVKVLDLDLMLMNMAYSEERLDRISSVTGMSRKLVENLVTRAKK